MPAHVGPHAALRPRLAPSTSVSVLAASVEANLMAAAESDEVFVTGVEHRSAALFPGDLFAALPGAKAHGAGFAGDAIENGAAAILTDETGYGLLAAAGHTTVPVLVHPAPRAVLGEVAATIYGRPSERMTIIGVTGTSGKTTTSYLIEAALRAAGREPGLIGTIETRVKGERVPSALTTPEAPQLHAMFAAMLEQGTDCVVMEVSSHALSLGRVDGTHFAVAAFTNLSQDHLDFHPSFEDYFAAKARLFAPGSSVRAERAVVCIDDEWGRRMAETAGVGVTTVATGTSADWTATAGMSADWTATAVEVLPNGGQSFRITGPGPWKAIPARLRLPGGYNVANALLAVAATAAAGVDPVAAARSLAEVDVPGRVERVDRGQEFLAVVDYAHKPAALSAVIATLRAQATGRIALVVGAGGDRDHGKRPMMGEVGALGADLLIVTDDNPRSEDPAAIRAAMLAGANAVPEAERGDVREIGDRAAAIAAAVEWANTGDVVLVAGKGHETGQEIKGVKYPFDDREVLADAIERGRAATADTERGSAATADTERGRDGGGDPRVIALSLARIAEIVGGTLHEVPDPDTVVTGSVEFDSRKIGPGDLFLALPGARVDGHDHAPAALAAGAVAVLAARAVGVPAIVVPPLPADAAQTPGVAMALEHDTDGSGAAVLAALAKLARAVVDDLGARTGLTVVGVTGSSGKTSTKDLLAAVLSPLGPVVAPPGSFNNELGHPWTALRADEQTRSLVLELSARGIGHVAALAAVAPPRIGVVLNVGTAHLGEFGSREAIAQAKGELVEALPPAADGGVAVLNADDPLVAAMAARTQARVVTVGQAAGADVRATDIELDDRARARFVLECAAGRVDIALAVHGEHQVGNALAAAAVALECGLGLDAIADALGGAAAASARRMDVRTRSDGVTVINDSYNANPDSMRAGLKALVSMARSAEQPRRSWAVLGEMGELGEESVLEHDAIGRFAVRLDVGKFVVVGAGRPCRAMYQGAVQEGSWGEEAVHVPDARAAIELLDAELAPGDLVLVKASQAIALWTVAEHLLNDVAEHLLGETTEVGN